MSEWIKSQAVFFRLDNFFKLMQFKFNLRKNRPPDPRKWPVNAVDEFGNRDWMKCSLSFLRKKLDEEVDELVDEMVFIESHPHEYERLNNLAMEAADVSLVAFMIAERAGVKWKEVLMATLAVKQPQE